MKQQRTGEGDQAGEQKKDGSCQEEEPESMDAEVSEERSGVQQHDRDRDQTNGGTGPQNRYGNE